MTQKQAKTHARQWRVRKEAKKLPGELLHPMWTNKMLRLITQTTERADEHPEALRNKLVQRGALVFDGLRQMLAAMAKKQLK